MQSTVAKTPQPQLNVNPRLTVPVRVGGEHETLTIVDVWLAPVDEHVNLIPQSTPLTGLTASNRTEIVSTPTINDPVNCEPKFVRVTVAGHPAQPVVYIESVSVD